MENSFSLQFNPMQQLKTVQDYEQEIERLNNENFEIKHQLSYYKINHGNIDNDVQKLLYDSKMSIDILENENKNLQKQLEHMKELIRNNAQDKDVLKNDLKNNLSIKDNEINNLEEENKRLINHLEVIKNKYETSKNEQQKQIQDLTALNNQLSNQLQNNEQAITALRSENTEIKNMNSKLVSENINLKNDKELYFTEGEKLLNENNNIREQYKMLHEEKTKVCNDKMILEQENNKYKLEKENLHKYINEKEQECNQYKTTLKNKESAISNLETKINEYEKTLKDKDSVIDNLKLPEQYFKELQKNFNKECNDKQQLIFENEKLQKEMKVLRENFSNIRQKLEIVENEKRAMKYRLSIDKNTDVYSILNQRMHNEFTYITSCVDEIQKQVDKLFVNEHNKQFLHKMNINTSNINDIVTMFKCTFNKLKDRNEILRREVHDISKFKNGKTMDVLKTIAEEFKVIKSDLDNCKKYLEKKSKELKEIRKEKLGLEKKCDTLIRRLDETHRMKSVY